MKLNKSDWKKIEEIAVRAGEITLKYWQNDIEVFEKEDGSPVSNADYYSEKEIITGLSEICNYPILSEEGNETIDLSEGYCFVVDPLDGTKSFIKGREDFAINIALLKDSLPVAGIIYAPALRKMYSCFNGEVFFNGKKMSLTKRELPLKGARSFNHPHQSEIDFFETNKVENALNIGSSLKFAYLISGEIDLYIRYAPCSEWDTASGHALLQAYGGDIIDLSTKTSLQYGKKITSTAPFLAYVDGTDFTL